MSGGPKRIAILAGVPLLLMALGIAAHLSWQLFAYYYVDRRFEAIHDGDTRDDVLRRVRGMKEHPIAEADIPPGSSLEFMFWKRPGPLFRYDTFYGASFVVQYDADTSTVKEALATYE